MSAVIGNSTDVLDTNEVGADVGTDVGGLVGVGALVGNDVGIPDGALLGAPVYGVNVCNSPSLMVSVVPTKSRWKAMVADEVAPVISQEHVVLVAV